LLNILVAEDNRAERLFLADVLKDAGFAVKDVASGAEAIQAFQDATFDLVLLDVMMGEDSGKDVASEMRALQKDSFIPVVFITGLSVPADIAACLKVGDDLVQKPIQKEILLAKIDAIQRVKKLYSKIKYQRDEIDVHRNAILREQDFAKKIYDRIARSGILDSPYIRHYVSPQAFFNGDVILAANHPLGGLLFFVGDFTGHGLPAALGALPLSDIFYSMTAKGYNVPQILRAMNQKLRDVLPSEIFCAAILLYIDTKERYLQAWNGGLPPGRIRHINASDDTLIKSKHMPLGILEDLKFDADPEYIEINEGDHIFLFSDGVYEAFGNNEQELEHAHRMVDEVFEKYLKGDAIFEGIIRAISELKGPVQNDDVTLVDIKVAPFGGDDDEQLDFLKETKDKIDWHLSLFLGPNSLRFF